MAVKVLVLNHSRDDNGGLLSQLQCDCGVVWITRRRNAKKAKMCKICSCRNGAKVLAESNPAAFNKKLLMIAMEALEKIEDPRKLGHAERDDYTRLACVRNVAHEALKEIKFKIGNRKSVSEKVN